MSIEQESVVDYISFDATTEVVTLTISDHLNWKERPEEHVKLLQNKLENYMRFVESDEIYATYPNATGHPIQIVVVGQFPLTDFASTFYNYAKTFTEEAGLKLTFRELPVHEK
jgi:hypothetical protein